MLDHALQLHYPSSTGAECPYPVYDYWRSEEPVYLIPGRHPATFVVSRYEDVRFVARHPELFSSVHSRMGLNRFDFVGEGEAGVQTMLESDPPEARAKRDLAFAPLKPGRLREYAPWVEQIVDELIDGFAGRGSCDFVEEFARPLPVRVMMRLFGIPGEFWPMLYEWSDLEASGLSWLSPAQRDRQLCNARRFGEFLTERVAQSHAEPGEDVISEIIAAQVARDGTFNAAEVRAQASVVLAGGAATTQHMMGGAMLLLIEHPEELARARADLGRIPRILEEATRIESSVQWVPRVVKEAVEIAGVTLPVGSYVLCMWGSANRDPSRFEDPERFDPDRPELMAHMAFGSGPHTCLGAPLARLEGRIAFERLLTRLGDLSVDPDTEIRHVESPSFRGLEHLHLRFTASPG